MLELKFYIWVLILAIIHSLWEIQIEGREGGWARHLPTFRINIMLTKLLLGKELTGYHIYMCLLFVTIFHGILLFQTWSWKVEAQVFGLLSWYFIIEDFLWFFFNKHYTLRKFRPGKILWHKRWFLGLPYSYWWGGIIGTFLLIMGGK